MSFGELLRKPSFVLRVLEWLFAIIVFACIADKVKAGDVCLYNGNSDACGYGIGIGVIAFLLAMLFMTIEIVGERLGTAKRIFDIVELGLTAIWTFLWFVGFCFLTDQWRKSIDYNDSGIKNNAQAAIAFSFFSFFAWAASTFYAYRKYTGADSSAASGGWAGETAYTSYQDNPTA
eukprot:Colp12_sorted_trinity150504_noHs@463